MQNTWSPAYFERQRTRGEMISLKKKALGGKKKEGNVHTNGRKATTTFAK